MSFRFSNRTVVSVVVLALVGGLIGTKIGKRVGGAILDKMGSDNCFAAQAASAPTTGTDRVNLASEFERLVQLRDAGVLTEDEFKAAKAKLLGL